jgi:hypothetical protein
MPYTPRQTRRLHIVPTVKRRILLVCDAPTERARYAAALASATVEVVGVTECSEIKPALLRDCALAIVNVAAPRLVETLAALRADDESTNQPILVEASDALGEARFAGVLPRYRAMACNRHDLIELARLRLAPRVHEPHAGRML